MEFIVVADIVNIAEIEMEMVEPESELGIWSWELEFETELKLGIGIGNNIQCTFSVFDKYYKIFLTIVVS